MSADTHIIGERLRAVGYKQGLEESGDERLLQSGFNAGFAYGVSSSYNIGYLRGFSTGSFLSQMLLSNNNSTTSTQQSTTTLDKASASQQQQSVDDEFATSTTSTTTKSINMTKANPKIYQSLQIPGSTLSAAQSECNNTALETNLTKLQLLLILTLYSKQLLSRNNQAVLDQLFQIKTTITKSTSSTAPEVSQAGNASTSYDDLQITAKVVNWINTLSSGRWSTPFAKVDSTVFTREDIVKLISSPSTNMSNQNLSLITYELIVIFATAKSIHYKVPTPTETVTDPVLADAIQPTSLPLTPEITTRTKEDLLQDFIIHMQSLLQQQYPQLVSHLTSPYTNITPLSEMMQKDFNTVKDVLLKEVLEEKKYLLGYMDNNENSAQQRYDDDEYDLFGTNDQSKLDYSDDDSSTGFEHDAVSDFL